MVILFYIYPEDNFFWHYAITISVFFCFVQMIYVYIFICLCILYDLLIGCTLSWVVYPIYLLFTDYFNTISSLYLCLYWYFCSYFIYVCRNMFVSFILSTHWLYLILVKLSFIFPVYHFSATVSPFSLTYIHTILWTPLHFNFPLSCCMHWNTYICS